MLLCLLVLCTLQNDHKSTSDQSIESVHVDTEGNQVKVANSQLATPDEASDAHAQPPASADAKLQESASVEVETNQINVVTVKATNEDSTRQHDEEEIDRLLKEIENVSNEAILFSKLEVLAQKGHTNSMFRLADGLCFGDHPTNKNITAAIDWYRRAAALGDPDAQHQIALFYSLGLYGFPKYPAMALLYHTFAADGGSSESQLVLANMYMNGIGVPAGCHKAAFYINKVADRVVDALESDEVLISDRMIRLNEDLDHIQKQDEEDEDIIDFYHYSAENGDVRAQSALGSMYLTGGHGLPPDPVMARMYFEMAVDSGDVTAYGSLGEMFLQGKGVQADNETAYMYFQKGAKKGHASSLNGLGYMHMHGFGVLKNITLAIEFFRKAAERGYAEAQYNLGLLYLDADKQKGTVHQDFPRALRYFSLAAQSGHTLSTFHLAQMHLNGLGTSMNCPIAVTYLRQVVEKGPWGGSMGAALEKYRKGDLESALLLYLDASLQGFSVATFNAAYLLHHTEPTKVVNTFQTDDGVEHENITLVSAFQSLQNSTDQYQLALELYKLSAKSGNTEANIYIGDIFYYGLSVDVDLEKSGEFYRLAADANHPQALYNIGFMHQFGLGMAKDFHMAKRNFDLVGVHARGSLAVAYAALAVLFVHWGWESAVEYTGEYADWVLICGLSFMLSAVLSVLMMRRSR